MRDATRRVTLKELAAALGLSPMTVSNAYNRPDQIAPATRARVLAEAARLGYTGPDPTARSLRRRSSGTVGILYAGTLSFAFSDPAAILFLQGVSLATEAAHLRLLLLSGTPGDRTLVAEAAVDGILALALADDDPLLAAALARRLPLVLVDQAPKAGADRVGIDDQGGARAAAAHLLALGHRHLGILSLALGGSDGQRSGPAGPGRQSSGSHPVARARLQGYAAALATAALAWEETPVYECATTTPAEGAAAASWLLAREPRPTALLAMSDQLALGAMDAARSLGIAIPSCLSVVGFDDVPAAARADPGLTTVHQPHVEKGRLAAARLVAALQGEGSAEPITLTLPTKLVIRGSTAPPASGGSPGVLVHCREPV